MLIKYYETSKIDLGKSPFILFHGNNIGLKSETLRNLLGEKKISSNYDEKEILDNSNEFLENLISKSLFENEKIIFIKRCTEKINKIISEIINKKIKDTTIILDCNLLEKKSKLRSLFEKEKKCISVAFYPDNQQTLMKIAINYLNKKKIFLSRSDLNIILNNASGDREILLTELKKLELYSNNGKKINTDIVLKLTNLLENHDISELVNYCLAQNHKQTIKILNENNFSNEDCVLILRTLLNKLKKILNLFKELNKNNSIELTISSAKPPIFWKDKELTKQQLLKWSPNQIKKIIYELSTLELKAKKNIGNSLNLITDFIINLSNEKINN